MKKLRNRIRAYRQRAKRGWADCDVWSLDIYLARVIGESLQHLAHTNHGWDPSRYKTPEEQTAHHLAMSKAFLEYSTLFEQHHESFEEERQWMLTQLQTMREILEPDVWPGLWD